MLGPSQYGLQGSGSVAELVLAVGLLVGIVAAILLLGRLFQRVVPGEETE